MIKLKPCPFCGGRASLLASQGVHGAFAHIVCDSCGAETRGKTLGLYTDIESDDIFESTAFVILSQAWNRRTE